MIPNAGLKAWHGKELEGVLENKFGAALWQIGRLCANRIKRSMGPSVSAPGQPPGRETSTYLRSIDFEVDTGKLIARIGTADKRGPWLELGTGLYGPRGRPIQPRTKPFLVFRLPDGSWIRTRQVRGMKPRPHIKPGVYGARPAIMQIIERAGV